MLVRHLGRPTDTGGGEGRSQGADWEQRAGRGTEWSWAATKSDLQGRHAPDSGIAPHPGNGVVAVHPDMSADWMRLCLFTRYLVRHALPRGRDLNLTLNGETHFTGLFPGNVNRLLLEFACSSTLNCKMNVRGGLPEIRTSASCFGAVKVF